jgi:penicillin-binding protein 1C
MRTTSCPYHQVVHLDVTGKWRVTGDCELTTNMIHRSWFVLPPAQEWFYRSKNNQYVMLPPFRKDCNGSNKTASMEFIYPKRSTQIYVPVEIDGKTGKTIFEVASRNANSVIYWNLDDEYIGSTKQFHQFALSPAPGKHLITLVDEHGERLEQYFEILKRD